MIAEVNSKTCSGGNQEVVSSSCKTIIRGTAKDASICDGGDNSNSSPCLADLAPSITGIGWKSESKVLTSSLLLQDTNPDPCSTGDNADESTNEDKETRRLPHHNNIEKRIGSSSEGPQKKRLRRIADEFKNQHFNSARSSLASGQSVDSLDGVNCNSEAKVANSPAASVFSSISSGANTVIPVSLPLGNGLLLEEGVLEFGSAASPAARATVNGIDCKHHDNSAGMARDGNRHDVGIEAITQGRPLFESANNAENAAFKGGEQDSKSSLKPNGDPDTDQQQVDPVAAARQLHSQISLIGLPPVTNNAVGQMVWPNFANSSLLPINVPSQVPSMPLVNMNSIWQRGQVLNTNLAANAAFMNASAMLGQMQLPLFPGAQSFSRGQIPVNFQQPQHISSGTEAQNLGIGQGSTFLNNPNVLQNPPKVAMLYLPCDRDYLSEYQIQVRKQLQVFEATKKDTETKIQGRKKPVFLAQVGLRCKHCIKVPLHQRGRGSVYFPTNLGGLYPAAQNMAVSHLHGACPSIPASTREELVTLHNSKDRASGGKEYWADAGKALGLYESTGGIKWASRV